MRWTLILLPLLLYLVDSKKVKHYGKTKTDARLRRQAGCAGRGGSVNTSSPAHISGDACCSGQLGGLLRAAMRNPNTHLRLGDNARTVQKRVQQRLGHSYEVIISRGDFSLSSHYHGMKACKVHSGDFYTLAYETPISYNVDDLPEESRLASVDAQESLGSTPEDRRGHFPDVRTDPLAGEDSSLQPSPRVARAATFSFKFGNNTDLRQGEDLNEGESRLPEGSSCVRGQTGGGKCCSGSMFAVMETVLNELSTSPEFDDSEKSPGVTANLIKRRMQQKFGRVFEVIVSNADFEHASYHIGDFTCNFESHGLHLLAYETPHQSHYDPFNLAEETHYSSISDPDPLGTSEISLPNQLDSAKPLKLEMEGDRAGFPKGSHCNGGEKSGSACCNLGLFNAMHTAVKDMQAEDSFNQYDRRVITRRIRTAAEQAIGKPMEVVVSNDDFVVSSNMEGDTHCKFRIERYFIMAWETPSEDYGLGEDHYADNGYTSMVGCGQMDAEGASCCNGELRYTITKAVDETNSNEYTKGNTQAVARAVIRAAQKRFNMQMNTVVSRGDFIWRHADGSVAETSEYVCKIDIFDFHVLTFESGTGTPTETEFLTDVPDGVCLDCEPPIGEANIVPEFIQEQVPLQPPVVVQPFQQQIPLIVQQQIPLIVQQQIPAPSLQTFQQVVPPQVQQVIQVPQPIQPEVSYFRYNYNTPPVAAASFCFSEDTWVQTPTGKKNMAQLELGDFVLTANITHAYFAQVTVWMHRNPEKVAHFYTIMTEYGKMLRMTAKHFIYRHKCDDNYREFIKVLPASGEEIFASELAVGDCVILYHRGQWQQQRIKQIKRTKRKGIYAPLTTNGRIIVNDILASCYADVKGHTFQSTYFEAMSLVKQGYYKITGWLAENNIELPATTDLWRDILSLVLPN